MTNSNMVPAPRFTRTDRDASEVLALVRVMDAAGNAITSSFADENEDRSPEYPYLVQITTGPNAGDDFVGLYGLDGDRIETGHGWTWEIVSEAPASVVDAIETNWESGTSVVAKLAASNTSVVVETMPDYLRGSHRAARNWGRYPHNGAERIAVSREEAEEIVVSDPDGYARIVESESEES